MNEELSEQCKVFLRQLKDSHILIAGFNHRTGYHSLFFLLNSNAQISIYDENWDTKKTDLLKEAIISHEQRLLKQHRNLSNSSNNNKGLSSSRKIGIPPKRIKIFQKKTDLKNYLREKKGFQTIETLCKTTLLGETIIETYRSARLGEIAKASTDSFQNPQAEVFTDILLSPGVPRNLDFLILANQMKIPIWADVDFFFPIYKEKKIIGVTGTNGKTSVVSLVHFLLEKKLKSLLAGNIGTPIAKQLTSIHHYDVVVIELSSYMLEVLRRFRPDIAIIINLGKDHLDRYASLKAYHQAKLNITQNQTKDQTIIIPVSRQVLLSNFANKTPIKKHPSQNYPSHLPPNPSIDQPDKENDDKLLKEILSIEKNGGPSVRLVVTDKHWGDVGEKNKGFHIGKKEEEGTEFFPNHPFHSLKSTMSSKIIAYTEQGMIHWTNQPNAQQKTRDGQIRDREIGEREIGEREIGEREIGDRKILDNRDRLQLYIPDENILLAIAAANLVADFQQEEIQNLIEHFQLPPHRLEKVSTYRGTLYLNDSKSTTPQSTTKALDFFSNKKVFLILGGQNKNLSFSSVLASRDADIYLYLYGEARHEIKQQIQSHRDLPIKKPARETSHPIKKIIIEKNFEKIVRIAFQDSLNVSTSLNLAETFNDGEKVSILEKQSKTKSGAKLAGNVSRSHRSPKDTKSEEVSTVLLLSPDAQVLISLPTTKNEEKNFVKSYQT